MEVKYRRDLNETFMILGEESPCEEFALRILKSNDIEGLMPLTVRETDGTAEYYFRITRGNSLFHALEKRPITPEEIRGILFGLSRVLDRMEEYLLDRDHLILTPEFIYLEAEGIRTVFCCHPAFKKDFFTQLQELIQYFLGKLDHTDRKSVEMIYEMYEISRQEYFRFEDLLEAAGTSGRRAEEKEDVRVLTADSAEEKRGRTAPEQEDEGTGIKNERVEKKNIKRDRKFPLFSAILLFCALLAVACGILQQRAGRTDWRFFAAAGILAGAAIVRVAVSIMASGGAEAEESEEEEGEERERSDSPEEIRTENQRAADQRFAGDQRAAHREFAGDLYPSDKRYTGVPRQADKPSVGERCDSETEVLGFAPRILTREKVLISENSSRYETIRINRMPFTIGKGDGGADYCLDDPFVSRIHARLEEEEGCFFLTDCRSTNGTFINGERLDPGSRFPVKEGDEVMLANLKYIFQ